MTRQFRSANYEEALDQKVSIREVLPPEHLARFTVEVIGQLDLNGIYKRYAPRGGEAIAPEILLGLLFYGHATGTFRGQNKITYIK